MSMEYYTTMSTGFCFDYPDGSSLEVKCDGSKSSLLPLLLISVLFLNLAFYSGDTIPYHISMATAHVIVKFINLPCTVSFHLLKVS